MFKCGKCDTIFTHKRSLTRHEDLSHSGLFFQCRVCDKKFTRKDNLSVHMKRIHGKSVDGNNCPSTSTSRSWESSIDHPVSIDLLSDDDDQTRPDEKNSIITIDSSSEEEEPCNKRTRYEEEEEEKVSCDVCKVSFTKKQLAPHRRTNEHKNKMCERYNNDVNIIKSAFGSRVVSYRIKNSDKSILRPSVFLDNIKSVVKALVDDYLEVNLCFKLNIELFALYCLPTDFTVDVKSFNTRNEIFTISVDFNEVFEQWMHYIDKKVEGFEDKESGWGVVEIIHLELNFNKYSPLRGSSYIELPSDIQQKNACLNIINEDSLCFVWSILAALYPCDDKQNLTGSYKKYLTQLNLKDFQFPMKLKDITKFEAKNNISVNVFGLEYCSRKERHVVIGPYHHTKERRNRHVNLLLFEKAGIYHYCLIKKLSALVGKQISIHHGKKYICDGCLQYFYTEVELQNHQARDCTELLVELPSTIEESVLKFKNFHRKMMVNFTVSCNYDFV